MASSKGVYECQLSEGLKTAVYRFGSFVYLRRVEPSYALMKTASTFGKGEEVVFDVRYFVSKKNDWYMGRVQLMGESIADALAGLHDIRARHLLVARWEDLRRCCLDPTARRTASSHLLPRQDPPPMLTPSEA